MTLPPGLEGWLRARLGGFGAVTPVSGGCISRAARVETGRGPVFLKYRPGAPPGFFAAEAAGLARLAAAVSGLRLPAVIALLDAPESPDGTGALLLEWLEPVAAAADDDERLGRGLAALHRAGAAAWGGEPDGYIGALPQENGRARCWADFWRDRRLGPQLRLLRGRGGVPGGEAQWARLLAALPAALAPAEREGPSPLHGDLWHGNVLPTADGPALIDPAAYSGHREVDMAMAELFGGFGPRFRAAYTECWPLLEGYDELRRGVYQLYYLLVHVNLFGDAYAPQTDALLRRVVGAL